jgi:spermidine/putrescine transport system permease protein
VRRVLLPLLYPAILASFAIVFADTVDDFVTVTYLSGPANSQPLSTFIYVTARASATPAVNAAATLMLVSTTLVICLGYLAFKRLTRGQEAGDVTAFSQL